jgi:hypothetical protein
VQRDDALEILGEMRAPFRLAPGEPVMREIMRVRQMIDAVQPTEMPPKPTP